MCYCASKGFLGSAVVGEHRIQWLELDPAARIPGAAPPADAGESLGGLEVTGVRVLSCWYAKTSFSWFCFTVQKKSCESLPTGEYLPTPPGLCHDGLGMEQKLSDHLHVVLLRVGFKRWMFCG